MTFAPSPPPILTASAAIAAVKARAPQVAKIERAPADVIGASSDIKVLERADGWDLVFWEGWEDCPAGCINNRYYYFSVKRNGGVQKVGEYSRIYNPASNAVETVGTPMWGVPE